MKPETISGNQKIEPAQALAALSAAERERLILEHLPQVRLIAHRIWERLPGNVNFEDLVSTGTLGLIAAIDRYDANQGVKLKTYAEYKIRGAILDSLRILDWAPRRQRRRARQIDEAISAAEQRQQHRPTEQEIAAELGIDVEECREWMSEARTLRVTSLETKQFHDEGSELVHYVSDREDLWPSHVLERAELESLLVTALDRMPQTERTVLNLYYHEELTLREIASILDLHESRISQLKAQALTRLRTLLANRWPDKGAAVAK